jgi:L-alanine-DL-glutamate epimerase-like enolase superfamily enzyme
MTTAGLRDVSRLGTVDDARGMTITDVECVLLSHTYADAELWTGGVLPGITAGLVRITTSDGLTGIGETYGSNFAPEVVRAVVEHFRPFLVGQDPSDIAGLWQSCWSRNLYWSRVGMGVIVLSAIESALWDLVGKAVGKPVVELLGGAVHQSLPRYASGGMEASPPRLRAEQAAYVEQGFLATKIRAGESAAADFEKAALVRDVVGPDIGLAVDAVQGSNPNPWTADDAIPVAKALAELDLLWLEEPCSATDPEGHAAVRRAVDVPIAGAESCTTVHELRRYLEADALDLAQPDAAHIGGVLECRKAAALAESYGVDIAVHAWASGGCVMSNYHVAFASPNCTWLEYPTQPNPLITALLAEPLTVVDGRVLAPTAPGLGLLLTDEIEARFPYQPGHHYHFEERR